VGEAQGANQRIFKYLHRVGNKYSASHFTNLFSKAVQEAKEINRQNGLPNDFVINGKRFYELPNGEITTENPLAEKIN
jgi:hypothetical protein